MNGQRWEKRVKDARPFAHLPPSAALSRHIFLFPKWNLLVDFKGSSASRRDNTGGESGRKEDSWEEEVGSLGREGWGAEGRRAVVWVNLSVWGRHSQVGLGAGGGRRNDSKKSEVWARLCWQRSQVWTDQKEMTTGRFWNRFFNFPPFPPWRLRARDLESGFRLQLRHVLILLSQASLFTSRSLHLPNSSLRGEDCPSPSTAVNADQRHWKEPPEHGSARGQEGVTTWTEHFSPLCTSRESTTPRYEAWSFPSPKLLRGWGCRN